ncbi:MAG: glycosyltransferase family 2 protein [Gloeotrichia echinulata IR180]|jgi:GT2 family glycosyltransferase|nr:glycosyltransferase family 2 protein [Gloeotrichia echinulata DEX184]
MLEKTAKEVVYIIIPVHNRKNTTLACLENLQKCGDIQHYQVVIVDDASTDGSAEAIHSLYPDVKILPGNGELWWTGAMALGMQYASLQGAEYIFWLNDDCLPEPGTLPLMVKYMQTHPDTIVAPTCYMADDNSSIPAKNGFRGRQVFAASPGEVISVDGMSGWCVGIPSAVFDKIGYPDASKYPHYAGDDMYLLRATRAGFRACLLGDAKVNLVGGVRITIKFQHYFHPQLTFAETFQRLFWNKKSPYRLPTQFYRHTEKYGILLGSLLFSLKVIAWLANWAKYQFFTYYGNVSS